MSRERLADTRYVAVLAAAAVVILAAGFWFKPSPPGAEPAATEQDRATLNRILRRNALEEAADSMSEIARSLFASVVWVEGPGASGIAWLRHGRIVGITATNDLPGPPIAIVDRVDAMVARHRPANRPLAPGDWMIAIWRDASRQPHFAAGFHTGRSSGHCGGYPVKRISFSGAVNPEMAGGGVFDLNGDAVAVLLPCEGRLTPVSVESVDDLLTASESERVRVFRRYGLDLADPDDVAREYFRVKTGVLVHRVATGSLADDAGVLPGDVLLSINATECGNALATTRLLARRESGTMDVRGVRRGRAFRTRLAPEAGAAGIVASPDPAAIRVGHVTRGSPADRTGIRDGDRLIRIDGQPVRTIGIVSKQMMQESRSHLILERGKWKIGIFLGGK